MATVKKKAKKRSRRKGPITSEGGMVKVLAEAQMSFLTRGQSGNISGPVYKEVHAILAGIREKRAAKSFNAGTSLELGCAMRAIGDYLIAHPEASHRVPEGLKPYTPRPPKKKKKECPNAP